MQRAAVQHNAKPARTSEMLIHSFSKQISGSEDCKHTADQKQNRAQQMVAHAALSFCQMTGWRTWQETSTLE